MLLRNCVSQSCRDANRLTCGERSCSAAFSLDSVSLITTYVYTCMYICSYILYIHIHVHVHGQYLHCTVKCVPSPPSPSPAGVEWEAHSGDETHSRSGLRCSGQPSLLQGEHLHAAGRCQEDLRRSPQQSQRDLRTTLDTHYAHKYMEYWSRFSNFLFM